MTIPVLRRWSTASGAVVAELDPAIDAPTIFARLAHHPATLFLDSAVADSPTAPAAATVTPRLGRYSFVATDPIHSIHVPADTSTPAADLAHAFAAIRRLLADLACQTIPGLPPFQGGIAGLLAYECGLAVLGIPVPTARVTPAPLVSLHAYDVVFAFDHDTQQGWVISQGVPAQGPQARRQRASERLDAVLAHVAQASACESAPLICRRQHSQATLFFLTQPARSRSPRAAMTSMSPRCLSSWQMIRFACCSSIMGHGTSFGFSLGCSPAIRAMP